MLSQQSTNYDNKYWSKYRVEPHTFESKSKFKTKKISKLYLKTFV